MYNFTDLSAFHDEQKVTSPTSGVIPHFAIDEANDPMVSIQSLQEGDFVHITLDRIGVRPIQGDLFHREISFC